MHWSWYSFLKRSVCSCLTRCEVSSFINIWLQFSVCNRNAAHWTLNIDSLSILYAFDASLILLNSLYHVNIVFLWWIRIIHFFYVWLTVHPNRMIVYFYYQLDVQILYFNTFIIPLYMFRALLCSSSGGQTVLGQHLVPSLSLCDRSVHRLRESSRILCTERSPKESDGTRCCTNAVCTPEDEHNSARNM